VFLHPPDRTKGGSESDLEAETCKNRMAKAKSYKVNYVKFMIIYVKSVTFQRLT
jgi:hypothetical protein